MWKFAVISILFICVSANPLADSSSESATAINTEKLLEEFITELPKESIREARHLDNDLSKDSAVSALEEKLVKKLNSKCSQKDPSSCVMLKMVTYMNRLLKKSNLEISDSIEITQTGAVKEEIRKEDLEVDETSRGFTEESLFGELITEKLWSFVKSRSLKWRLFPETDVVLSASPDNTGNLNLGVALRSSGVEEGRKKNNFGPVIAAGIMKIGMLKVLAIKALALLVGKALLISKIAFLLAALLGLKKLFSHQKHVTYEVVAHPHHSHSAVESHGHESVGTGWGRSGEAHNLAYRGHLQR